MNLCREHGLPSRDQRQGTKDGACERCQPPQRKRRHSEPRKEKPKKDPGYYPI